ncbi:MAG: hypothetical protein ACRCX2_09235 [Paraclostridium sp.]
MNIDFNSLKSQQIDNKTLLNIMEVLYTSLKTEKFQNIILNEFVDDLKQDPEEFNVFLFTLRNNPMSINDILIFSEDGAITITPASIVKLDKNTVSIKSLQVKKGMNFFVTYKY